jgi:hypothetical protein
MARLIRVERNIEACTYAEVRYCCGKECVSVVREEVAALRVREVQERYSYPGNFAL